MKSYLAYIFDLDGTVYRGKEVIEDSKTFISYLKEKGIEPFYATNNANMTAAQVQEKLKKMGIETSIDQIMTSAIATAKYIATAYPQKTAKVLGGDGLKQALLDEGVEVVTEQPDVVAQGMNTELTYHMLSDICFDIQNGASFVVTNPDVKYPTERGFAPGNGALAEMVHTVTGVEPLYIGKPASNMLELIRSNFDLQKDDMIMIGDNYDTDMMCGIQYGIDTLHVNTGVSRTDDVKKKELRPTFTVDTLIEWVGN